MNNYQNWQNYSNPSNQTVFIEIRGATGGDEAKIWGQDLLRMYSRFLNKRNLKVVSIGEGVIKVNGPDIFNLLKNEAGVHRVQRIPTTEKRGRIHTSTATVAVLPEVKDKSVQIRPEELEIQFYRSGGHGGQNVNKVSTAVRLTHKPSGIVVTAQTERFQEQNRLNALAILKAKLWEREEQKKLSTIEGYRSIIGKGMRVEKIRTYNFPQGRVTDHRLNKSWHNLESIMEGNLEKVIEATTDLK